MKAKRKTHKEPDWEAIAKTMALQLNMAITKLRHMPDWLGILYDQESGKTYDWEESFIKTIELIPGWTVDRRWVQAKHLPARKRRKAYRELRDELLNEKDIAE